MLPMRNLALLCAALAVATFFVGQSIAESAKQMARLGQEAPSFSLQDQNGKTVSLSNYKGKVVVLEWFNDDCPYVQKHYNSGSMNATAARYEAKGVVWLAINSTDGKTQADDKQAAAKWKIDRPLLLDSGGLVGQTYGAKNTPTMYVINKNGKLVYWGAIDNRPDPDPSTLDGATNYVARALDEVLDDKPVSEPRTKPYGCGIHYPR